MTNGAKLRSDKCVFEFVKVDETQITIDLRIDALHEVLLSTESPGLSVVLAIVLEQIKLHDSHRAR